MSLEEDWLMEQVRALNARVAKLEEVCPGSNSETSPESNETSEKKSDSEDPSPAPTTASPSKKAQTGSSTAPSTGGGPGKKE